MADSDDRGSEPRRGRREWLRRMVDTAQLRSTKQVAVDPNASTGWLRQMTHRAMACDFQLLFRLERVHDANGAADGTAVGSTIDLDAGMSVFERLDQLESQLSYFRMTSELSRINAVASEVALPVEPRLFALLEQCLELSRATDGAIDVTAAPLTELWRTARAAERIPTAKEIEIAKRAVGYRYVELDADRRTIRFTRPGMRIDLGCIGKGFALDETAQILTVAGIRDFLYHGGFSSILARGARERSPNASNMTRTTVANSAVDGEETAKDIGNIGGIDDISGIDDIESLSNTGWTVGLRDPMRPERRLAKLRLRNRAIGTSGSQIQFFRYRGRRYGHLLDPRTGWPPQTNRAVTVVVPSATVADGLSTAFYVLTMEEIAAFCEKCSEQYPELAVLLVDSDTDEGQVVWTYGFEPGDLVLNEETLSC